MGKRPEGSGCCFVAHPAIALLFRESAVLRRSVPSYLCTGNVECKCTRCGRVLVYGTMSFGMVVGWSVPFCINDMSLRSWQAVLGPRDGGVLDQRWWPVFP